MEAPKPVEDTEPTADTEMSTGRFGQVTSHRRYRPLDIGNAHLLRYVMSIWTGAASRVGKIESRGAKSTPAIVQHSCGGGNSNSGSSS